MAQKPTSVSSLSALMLKSSVPMSKRVIITGITGQDGSYLAELLLAKGYGPRMEIQPNYLTMLRLAISKPELATA